MVCEVLFAQRVIDDHLGEGCGKSAGGAGDGAATGSGGFCGDLIEIGGEDRLSKWC